MGISKQGEREGRWCPLTASRLPAPLPSPQLLVPEPLPDLADSKDEVRPAVPLYLAREIEREEMHRVARWHRFGGRKDAGVGAALVTDLEESAERVLQPLAELRERRCFLLPAGELEDGVEMREGGLDEPCSGRDYAERVVRLELLRV